MTLTEFVDELHEGIDSFWAWRAWQAHMNPADYPTVLSDMQAWRAAYTEWMKAGKPKEPGA